MLVILYESCIGLQSFTIRPVASWEKNHQVVSCSAFFLFFLLKSVFYYSYRKLMLISYSIQKKMASASALQKNGCHQFWHLFTAHSHLCIFCRVRHLFRRLFCRWIQYLEFQSKCLWEFVAVYYLKRPRQWEWRKLKQCILKEIKSNIRWNILYLKT